MAYADDYEDDRGERTVAGEVIQGVCKDCQSGMLNNLLEQAFVYVSDNDDNEFLVCKNCGSQRLDLL